MPSWKLHLAVATEVLKKIQFENENEFLFGNVLPDINGYLNSDLSFILPHATTHYTFENKEKLNRREIVLEDFLTKTTLKQLKSSLMIGYYSHLLTDYYYNILVIDKMLMFENNQFIGLKKENKIIECNFLNIDLYKRNDMNVFENELKIEVKIPQFTNDLLEKTNSIAKFSLSEEDVKKIIKTAEKLTSSNNLENEYVLFNFNEMFNHFDACVNFVCTSLKIGFK